MAIARTPATTCPAVTNALAPKATNWTKRLENVSGYR